MNVILVPGFWLGAWSWQAVAERLHAGGHSVRALTLPGLESVDAPRAGIGLNDHVAAVVHEIDRSAPGDGPVVLVGHSGGGAVVWGAVDRRAKVVSRAVYVDTAPIPDGAAVNPRIPEVDGSLPLPPWDFFDRSQLVGLDDEALATFRARAVPSPVGAARDRLRLHHKRRYRVSTTVITCTFPSDAMRSGMAEEDPRLAELSRLEDLAILDFPTGHWPQFSRPDDLAGLVAAAVGPDYGSLSRGA